MLCLFLAPLAGGAGTYMALFFSSSLHWGTGQVGALLAILSISMGLVQIPGGVWIDKTSKLKEIIIAGLGALIIGWSIILIYPYFYTATVAEVLIGCSCALFMPAVASLSLGLVGLKNFDVRLGRNGVFTHLGNVLIAMLISLCIASLSVKFILGLFILFAFIAIAAITQVKSECVDYSHLHKSVEKKVIVHPLLGGFANLVGTKTSAFFTIAALFYTFADASMLPLMAQRIAHVGSKYASMHVPAALFLTEMVMIPVCYVAGKRAYLGRKPLLIIAYIFLFLRGFCFTFATNPDILVGLQVLDGISAGIFGLMLVLVISDLSLNTGRFNATLTTMGVLFTIVNGVAMLLFGLIASKVGYSFAFGTMAACAVIGGLLIWALVPETVKPGRHPSEPQKEAKT